MAQPEGFEKKLLETLGEAVIVTDRDWRITLWNRAAEELYGWTSEEVLNKPVSQFLHTQYEDPQETSQTAFQKLLREKIWRGRVRQQNRYGKFLWIASTVALMESEQGEMLGMIAVNRDITESKRTGEKLTRLEQLNHMILKGNTLDELFYLYAQGVVNLLPCTRIVLWKFLDQSRYAVVWQYYPDKDRWVRGGEHSLQGSPLAALRAVSQPYCIQDLSQGNYVLDGESLCAQDRSLLLLPIRAGMEVSFAIGLVHSEPGIYQENDLNFLLPSADMLSMALRQRELMDQLRQQAEENRRLYEKTRENEANLFRLSRALMNVQEEEKRRLARDFHDQLGQAITALYLNLTRISAVVKTAFPDLGQNLDDSLNLASTILNQVRSLSLQLHPKMLEDLGFITALRWLANNMTQSATLPLTLSTPEDYQPLPREVELAFYRVAQEALSNVLRHAQATHCWFTFEQTPTCSRLEICDDGRGFDLQQTRISNFGKSLGLYNLFMRAEVIGANLLIDTAPGKGTRVVLEWCHDGNPHPAG